MQIVPQTKRGIVDDLDETHDGEAHEEAKNATTIGQKVGDAVQLGALHGDELIVLEVDGETRYL